MKYSNVTICIPAFNEGGVVRSVVENVRGELPGVEIVIVDDGSTDDTFEKVGSISGVVAIKHARNIGYGGALKTAMRASHGEYICWVDADGQHNLEDLKKIINQAELGGYDAVIGARDKNSASVYSRLPGKVLIRFVAELVAREKIPDINSGLRCFRREVILKYLHLLPDGFSASTTSTLVMIKRGYQLGYVPITTSMRKGKSSVKIVRDGFRTLKLVLRIFILFDAFNFFSFLAVVQVCFALVYGSHSALVNKLGFPTLGAMIFISGMLTFFMGIVTDQITELRKERFEGTDLY